jgi:hypothetical protein
MALSRARGVTARHRRPRQGSPRNDSAAVLRAPVLMCVKNWDYLKLRDRIVK